MRVLIVEDEMGDEITSHFAGVTSLTVSALEWSEWSKDPVRSGGILKHYDVVELDERDIQIRTLKVHKVERAWRAMEYLFDGFNAEPPIPEVAAIDIDFPVEKEDVEGFGRVNAVPPDSVEPSARLGWAIASRFRNLCVDSDIVPEIIMYSGKQPVVSGVMDLAEPVTWRGVTIPPFIEFRNKIEGLGSTVEAINEAIHRVGQRHLNRCVITSERRVQLEELLEDPENKITDQTILPLLYQFGDFFECFPLEVAQLLLRGANVLDAATKLMDALRSLDYHLELQKALKKQVRKDEDYFATPLAAVCHGWAWNYNLDKPMLRSGHFLALEHLEEAAQEEQRERLEIWFSDKCTLPDELKDRIRKDAVAGIFLWARTLNLDTAVKNWENQLAVAIPAMLSRLPAEIQASVQIRNLLSQQPLLTDWRRFFLSSGSVFETFLLISHNQGARLFEIWTHEHKHDRSVELVVRVVRADGKHVGSLDGLKGQHIDKSFHYWGSCWYQWSFPPTESDAQTSVFRHRIWPRPGTSEYIGVTPANKPILELHWHIPNLLHDRRTRH